MSRFKNFEFGFTKETEVWLIVKKIFNDNSICKLDRNTIFDFIGYNKLIELKSRHNFLSKYPTTMIGYNNIKKASEVNNKDVFFPFVLMIVWLIGNMIKIINSKLKEEEDTIEENQK